MPFSAFAHAVMQPAAVYAGTVLVVLGLKMGLFT